MTKKQNKTSYLRLIKNEKPTAKTTEPRRSIDPRQQSLFPLHVERTIVGLPMSSVSDATFFSTISDFAPTLIFDLRVAPNFNIGNLSRRSAFDLFTKMNARYYDYAGKHNIFESRDAKLNPKLFSEFVKSIIADRGKRNPHGSICILGRENKDVEEYCKVLADDLSNRRHEWRVVIL